MIRPLLLSFSLAACLHAAASPISSLQFSSERPPAGKENVPDQAVKVQLSPNSAAPGKTSSSTPAAAKPAASPAASPLGGNSKSTSQREQLLAQGRKLIGTPYLWGGTTPKGFDCSGFVSYLYGKQGYSLPRTSNDQFNQLTAVKEPAPGDLVFFRGKSGRITHVGMYIGNGNMLHSPQSGESVRIESMEKPNWKRRYAGARRVLPQGESKAVMVADSGKSAATGKSGQAVQLQAQPGKGNLFQIK